MTGLLTGSKAQLGLSATGTSEHATTTPRVRSGRFWKIAAAAMLTCLVPLGVAHVMPSNQPSPPPATAALPARTAVVALGWLVPASEVIRIAAPGVGDSSRIGELRVQEGQHVAAGQILAVLDTADKLKAQVASAEAQVALKRLSLARMRLDIANTRAARKAALDRARADVEQYKAEFERQQTLVAKDIATASNFEKRKRDLTNARAMVEEAARAIERIDSEAPVSDAPQAPAQSVAPAAAGVQIDVAVAEQELRASEAELALARVNHDQAFIRAPFAGRVLALYARAGEKISADGLMEMGATDRMQAVAEVYQSDIGFVHIGQSVEIKADAVPHRLTGAVERVGLRVKRQTIINNDPATDTDARVVEVRVALDPASSALVAGLTRLQVRVFLKL